MIFDEYARLLGAYTKPEGLIGTRATSTSSELCIDENADLLHDVWIVRTDDPTKKRNPERIVAFDQVIDVGGVRLNDPRHLHDSLTLRIWVLETLRGQYLSKPNAIQMLSTFNAGLWVLRWRNSLPLTRFYDVTSPLFEDFCDRLKSGAMALVPYKERLEVFCKRIEIGEAQWPISNSGNRIRTDATAVAEQLGLRSDAAMTNPDYVRSVCTAAARTAPQLAKSAAAHSDFDSLVKDVECLDDEDPIEKSSISVSAAKRYFVFWYELRRLSTLGLLQHDSLHFDPFAFSSVQSRADNIGGGRTGRTPTPGPKQWLGLLDAAARWVMEYSGPILRICDGVLTIERQYNDYSPDGRKYQIRPVIEELIELNFPSQRARPKLLPIWYRAGGAAAAGMVGLSLNEAVKHIIAACFILIGGLSARRAGELDSLQAGCVVRDPFGDHWLSSYIEKTVRDIEQIPVPAMVGRAVELLEDLSATGRARTGQPWLVNIDRPNAVHGHLKERIGYNLNWSALLNDFAKAVGLTDPTSGQGWHYAMHQLRRAFAVYYYHGNRYSNFDALSRYLRHFDPEVTRTYITDAIGGRLGELNELAKGFAKKMESMAASSGVVDVAAKQTRALATIAAEAAQSLRYRMEAYEEVRRESQTGRILEVFDGAETPIGKAAAALYDDLSELVEKARRHVRLERAGANGSPDEVRAALPRALKDYVKTHYLEPVSGGFAHCRCRPGHGTDLATASCLVAKRKQTGAGGDIQPDYAYASIEDCLGECPHGLAFSENQRVLTETVDLGLKAAPTAIVDSIVASITAAKAAVATRTRGKH